MSRDSIKRQIQRQIPYLSKKYHIKSIGIFGSVAKNEANKNSDVDILVEFKSPVGFFDFIRLENDLSKTVERKVDLVTKNALKPTIKEDILQSTIYV